MLICLGQFIAAAKRNFELSSRKRIFYLLGPPIKGWVGMGIVRLYIVFGAFMPQRAIVHYSMLGLLLHYGLSAYAIFTRG